MAVGIIYKVLPEIRQCRVLPTWKLHETEYLSSQWYPTSFDLFLQFLYQTSRWIISGWLTNWYPLLKLVASTEQYWRLKMNICTAMILWMEKAKQIDLIMPPKFKFLCIMLMPSASNGRASSNIYQGRSCTVYSNAPLAY